MRVICLISVLASGACAPAPAVSLEGADLIATFAANDSATLTIAFAGANVVRDGDSGACPSIASEGITFAGKALPDGDVSFGGGTSGACEPIGITTVVAGKDPSEDAELAINSGGATVCWIATNLLATRRFLRAGDPLDQVPRGSIVRVNHEPITDVLGDPEAVTLTDDTELALNFRLDEDGIVVDRSANARCLGSHRGAHHLRGLRVVPAGEHALSADPHHRLSLTRATRATRA